VVRCGRRREHRRSGKCCRSCDEPCERSGYDADWDEAQVTTRGLFAHDDALPESCTDLVLAEQFVRASGSRCRLDELGDRVSGAVPQRDHIAL
jgi:hypothetical protein